MDIRVLLAKYLTCIIATIVFAQANITIKENTTWSNDLTLSESVNLAGQIRCSEFMIRCSSSPVPGLSIYPIQSLPVETSVQSSHFLKRLHLLVPSSFFAASCGAG